MGAMIEEWQHVTLVERRLFMKSFDETTLREHGWLIHYLSGSDGEYGGLANIHTHGLQENFHHPDFQVVMPIPPEVIHPILTLLAEEVKGGRVFEPYVRQERVLKGMDVIFLPYRESGREVLRLVLPDPTGKLPEDEGCDPAYAMQIQALPEEAPTVDDLLEVELDDLKDNPRSSLFVSMRSDIEALAADIEKSGLRDAPTAYRSAEGDIVLIDGHRRLQAMKWLRDNVDPAKYATIQVRILEGVSADEAADLMLNANVGMRDLDGFF